jgi:hypothetical protein
MTYLDLVIIGIGIVCAGELGWLMARQEHLAQVLEMQIRALGATHLAGFEALTIEMQKLEQRVKTVEEEVL